MSDERNQIVRALMDYGHGAAKAFEIAIDCERGDKFATEWVNRALLHSCDVLTERNK